MVHSRAMVQCSLYPHWEKIVRGCWGSKLRTLRKKHDVSKVYLGEGGHVNSGSGSDVLIFLTVSHLWVRPAVTVSIFGCDLPSR